MKAHIDERRLKALIQESIKKEINRQYLIDESVFSKIASAVDKIIPSWAIKPIKSLAFRKFCKAYGIKNTSALGSLIQSIIEDIPLEVMAEIYSGEVNCEKLTPIITQVVSDTITKIGVKKLLIFIIQHYNPEDLINTITSLDPTYSKKDRAYTIKSLTPSSKELVSENQANLILNSLIGSVGVNLIESFVFKLVKEKIVPTLVDTLCDLEPEEAVKQVKSMAGSSGNNTSSDIDLFKSLGGSNNLKIADAGNTEEILKTIGTLGK